MERVDFSENPPRTEFKRAPKPKRIPPIEKAIRSWFQLLPAELIESLPSKRESLVSTAPKRWAVYTPMVLLPSGSFGPEWEEEIQRTTIEQKRELWKFILREISKKEGKGELTHLAINSGIPPDKSGDEGIEDGILGTDESRENVFRTPSGLIMIYGDFGPHLSPHAPPTPQDFESAFWVSTKQNGITQVWAPRYTMFSRGNIKEKARLLDFHKSGPRKASLKELESAMAVDLYAGIGYFVFSYAAMGMGRVVGWELNPWSVEGLRRGAVSNGWTVRIVRAGEELVVGDERIVIFLEDNQKAEERKMSETGKALMARRTTHVNCGLLPTSLPVWQSALRLLDGGGWLHLHENVGVNDIQKRASEIEGILQEWESSTGKGRTGKIEHVELVKTFAPGVWHCVFDVSMFFQPEHPQHKNPY